MPKDKPEIRFAGYTDAWEERKLGDIFVYKQGQQVPVENQFTKQGKNRHRFIRIVDLTTKNEAPRYIEYSGDNIISSTDLFMIRYGQPGVIGYGYEGVIANNLFKLIPKIETYNLFFKYILDSMYPKIQSLSSSTTMPAISFKSLDVLEVRYPDKKEQEKIGSFFKQLDDTIALHQRKLDLLKEQKKGFLQKMFPKNGAKIPELRFEGFTDDWEKRKLKDMAKYKNGKGHEDKQSETGMLELVNLNSIGIEGGFKHSGKYVDSADDTLLKNDLVMILSDVGHGNLLGRVALIPESNKFVLNQRVALLRPNKTGNSQFLFSYINAHQRYFKSQGAGMSQLNISKSSVENFNDFVPLVEEQKKIGTFLHNLDQLITVNQRRVDLLKQEKKALLQKMFV